MYRPTMLRVWAFSPERRRCRYCKRRIVWLTTDEGKRLPFEADVKTRGTAIHPTTLARFDVVSVNDRHSCEERRTAMRESGR